MRKRMIVIILIISVIMVFPGCVSLKAKPATSDTSGMDTAGTTEGIDVDENDPADQSGTDSRGNTADNASDNTTDNTTDNSSGNTPSVAGQTSGDSTTVDTVAGSIASGASYRLKEPQFIELGNISFCQTVKDYIDLSEGEFSNRYSDEKLWEQGAFDRLLFTKYSKGKIIGDIGIGSTLQQVLDTFGDCQFGTAGIVDKAAANYKRYLLYGYKTRELYFAFRIDPDTQLVDSICFRKRYPLPDDMKDMLVVLSEFGDWFGGEYLIDAADDRMEKWNKFFENDMITQTQWGRGTLTIICDYGFTSTSGMGCDYGVYADYSGDIPVLPARQSEWGDGTYEPVTVFEYDYPEMLIYRIYNYLAEQEDAIKYSNGMLSPDGSMFAYALEGDWLDMRSSGLYEWAHVMFHSMDGRQPDKQIYFGHFSSLVGFINDRYFAETNMMGLHVVDLKDWSIVYSEDTIDGGYDLKLDKADKKIIDSDGNVWYRYEFDSAGRIKVHKADLQ